MDTERSGALTWVMGAVVVAAVFCQVFEAARPQIEHGSEAATIQTARTMLQRGDWLTPRNEYGWPQLNRSVLTFWMSAAPMGLFGESLFHARLGAIALTAGTLAFIYLLAGALRLGRTAGGLAVIVYATTRTVYSAGHTAGEETVITFFVTAALYFFARLIFIGGEGEWRDAALAYAATAGALLAAGLGGLPCVVLPLAVFLLIPRRLAEPHRFLFWPVGAVVLAALALPWYGLMIAWHREALGQALFPAAEALDLLAALGDGARSLAVGPLLLLRDTLPWSLVAVVGLLGCFGAVRRATAAQRRELLYLAAWVVGIVIVVAFTRMATGRRLLPAMPAMALGIGFILSRALEADPRSRPVGVGILLAALGASGAAGLCAAAGSGAFVPATPLGVWGWALAIGLLLAAILAAALVFAGRVVEALLWTSMGALCMNLAGSLILHPTPTPPVAALASEVLARQPPETRVAVVTPMRSARTVAALYSGRRVDEWMEAGGLAAQIGYVRTLLDKPGRRALLIEEDLYRALPSDIIAGTRVLGRRAGMARAGGPTAEGILPGRSAILPPAREKAWYVIVAEAGGRP